MFQLLLENSLKNRLLVLLGALILTLYGAFTLTQTPVDVFPDLNKPTVTVITEAGGMAPEEVEQLITFPLEAALNGLPGVEVIRSVSSAGLSFSTSLSIGMLKFTVRAKWCPSGLAAWKNPFPPDLRPPWGLSVPSWAKSCKLPFPSMWRKPHPWMCGNMQTGC